MTMQAPSISSESPANVVIKVGTNVVTRAVDYPDRGRRLDYNNLFDLASEISDVMADTGNRVILVSSGAVAAGREKIKLPAGTPKIPGKQAHAGVGQTRLLHVWENFFGASAHPNVVAQHLVTYDDLDSDRRKKNIQRTLAAYPEGVIPIFNENDTVATEELNLGDNDQLASRIARLVHAQTLILLSDVDGVYNKNPQTNPDAELIQSLTTTQLSDEFIAQCGVGGNESGSGGMASKLRAARDAAEEKIVAFIANGKKPGTISSILKNPDAARGTRVTLG